MCHVMRMALVVVAAFQASAALSVATAQSSGGTLQACSLLSPAEFKQITGRTDILSRGPQAAEPDEVNASSWASACRSSTR
jgi:H+/gluconate symporter-like permease